MEEGVAVVRAQYSEDESNLVGFSGSHAGDQEILETLRKPGENRLDQAATAILEQRPIEIKPRSRREDERFVSSDRNF